MYIKIFTYKNTNVNKWCDRARLQLYMKLK